MESIKTIDWKQFGVFTEGAETAMDLFYVFTIATVGFTVFYYMNKALFPMLMQVTAGPEGWFFKLDEKNKREYYSRNVADLHAAIAAPLSFYSVFFICDDPT